MAEKLKNIIYNLVRKKGLTSEEIQIIDKIIEEKDYDNDIQNNSI